MSEKLSELLNSNLKVSIETEISVPMGMGIIGVFYSFRNLADRREHIAVKLGMPKPYKPPLVRVHSECLTGDVFLSQRCDCGPQLQEAIYTIHQQGGYLLYLRQEGRGIGLYQKLKAYELQDKGLDTYEANLQLSFKEDSREYNVAAEMLHTLGVSKIRLLSNNPEKVRQLEAGGISVIERISTGIYKNTHNQRYLETKMRRGNHRIEIREHQS